MLGNSRSSLASCSRNFYCIILCLLLLTPLVTSVSHNFWVYLYYYAMHEFCFSSFSHQVASIQSEPKIWKMCHTCLFDFKSYSFVGNPWVDSRITTHYTIFPFLVLCASSVASMKHQQKFSQAWTLPFAFVIHR